MIQSITLPERPIRRTIDFDQELFDQINEISMKKAWSFSYTTYVLLQQAIKEKNRKKSSSNSQQHTEKSQGRK